MPRMWNTICQWARISDEEADTLYSLWKNSPVGGKLVSAGAKPETVTALKTKGYISGYTESLELTSLGKRLIREMATHEPNSFEKNAKIPPYSKIREKKASRPRQTHVSKKLASAEEKVFNLRRMALRGISK